MKILQAAIKLEEREQIAERRKEEKRKDKQYTKQKKEDVRKEDSVVTVFLECLFFFNYVLPIAFVKLFERLICDNFLHRGILLGSVRNVWVLEVCNS